MNLPVLSPTEALENVTNKNNPYWNQYYAFYSSWYGGIIKNPGPLLNLPFDDHMVHRGDGVFEAMKSKDRKVFLLDPHLNRLKASAEKIGIALPFSLQEMKEIILQTLKVADHPDTLIRLFLSRGPGGFTANPYDSISSQFYVIITKLNPVPEEKYLHGVKIGRSEVPIKEGWMAQVKSCNYLPNVLMKKEAVDRKLDFTVSFDSSNFLAESSTENVAVVDGNGILTHPPFDKILKGTTMIRAFELAAQAGIKTAVRPMTEADLLSAQEIMMMGTTLDVLPVTQYEDKSIQGSQVGSVSKTLRKLLETDFKNGISF